MVRYRVRDWVLIAALLPAAAHAAAPGLRKVVLIAGPITGHPKGAHEYEKSVILLKQLLETSAIGKELKVEAHFKGWPADPATLDDADCIVMLTDGGDHREADHPLYVGDRLSQLEKQARRGCGFVPLHWSTFHPSRFHEAITEICGGYFDYETGQGNPKWFSRIETGKWQVSLPEPGHPVCRGVRPFEVEEEYYFKLRFRENDARLRPLLEISPASGGSPLERTVAWAIEREGGGRSFGCTGGHFFDNWRNDDFRKLVLNAIAWTAHATVPENGVETSLEEPIRSLIVTGHNHPAHEWRSVTAALLGVLEQDPRVRVDVTENPEELASVQAKGYGVLVLNYCNWDRPGLSSEAKAGLIEYLGKGGGLAVVHFANGAFNSTLPATDSDWPEYRTRIVRRVWMHGDAGSGHDPFGPFRVDVTALSHPITNGLAPFETEDELYLRQVGDLPIEPLATARSKITNRDEPMAWAYEFSKARVFQTVLGHSDVSVRKAGALIRRGAVWAAGRTQLGFDPPASITEGLLFRDGSTWSPARSLESEKKRADTRQGNAAPAATPEGNAKDGPALVGGRFGAALDARKGGVVHSIPESAADLPVTVECWAKLDSKLGFNILVASEPKASPTHWEIYTYAGSGRFSLYAPGLRTPEIVSDADVCDGKWHHLACVLEPSRARLYVDGKLAADRSVRRRGPPGARDAPGRIGLGRLVEGGIGCDGLVDEARIRRGAHAIDGAPAEPPRAEEGTLGLWQLDQPADIEPQAPATSAGAVDRDGKEPSSRASRPASLLPPNPALDGGTGGHWGIKNDADWVDRRIAAMDYGRFVGSSLATPLVTVAKSISIRVGTKGDAAVCFDSGDLSLRAGWTGGFLEMSPQRFGLIEMPRIAGEVQFLAPPGPGWGSEAVRYRGLHVHGARVVLEYAAGARRILDSPWIEELGSTRAISRTLEVGAGERDLSLRVLHVSPSSRALPSTDASFVAFERSDSTVSAVAIARGSSFRLELGDAGSVDLRIAAASRPAQVKLLHWSGKGPALESFRALVRDSPAAESLEGLELPGPPRWGEPIVTRGAPGSGDGPYVIDTLTLPGETPFKALLFLSGLDFFSNGDATVCTVHGDVWTVRGIDGGLEKLTWQRMATGLYQPLGLRVVNDRVHVLGRDQITRLADLNGDGEADFYECFSNASGTSPAGHDFHTCLETDSEGRFYYLSPTGLHRVSRDGALDETIATGWRNPNGLSISPAGVITVAPQEGEWTPASQISEAKVGGYYGYPGPRASPERPLGFDPPLCWIPRHIDNSTGGQAWVAGGKWGPLDGQLLSFSFGRSSMQLVLRDSSQGIPQGAAVPLKGRFLSGAMRGRFRPQDGQLYVTGQTGWVTNAVRDGCFQRVRYTGGKVYLPAGFAARANGLRVDFTEPLDASSVEDSANWSVRQWSYRYGAAYGSEEYSIAHPGQVGHDPVAIASVTALPGDGKSVFVELPSIQPVHQLHLKASLKARDGADAGFEMYATIHALGPPLELDASRATSAPEDLQDAAPEPAGLVLELTDPRTGATDSRVCRLAALRVPAGSPASPFLEPGDFHAVLRGRLGLEESGPVELWAEGRGKIALVVDGRLALEGEGDLSRIPPASLRLRGGRRSIRIELDPPAEGDAWFRIYWRGRGFSRETIPPAALTHLGESPALARGTRLREGRRLAAELGCLRCHPRGERATGTDRAMFELQWKAPSLEEIGGRLREGWMAAWIENPSRWLPAARMPALLAGNPGGARGIAAFLATLGRAPEEASPGGTEREGGELFAKLGCIACHLRPDDDRNDAGDGRLPLHATASKWKAAALRDYLLKPSRWNAGARMPDFKLTPLEAGSLASYLVARSAPNLTPGDAASAAVASGRAAEGRRLVQSLGCLHCHELRIESSYRAPSFEEILRADWSRTGCVAESGPAGRAPVLPATGEEKKAMRELGAAGCESLFRDTPSEAANRLVASLRCGACHERDGIDSRWSAVASECEHLASRAPSPITVQTRPSLTFTGEQLDPAWLRRFLAGELSHPLRPWLDARMPAFPAYADVLTEGFALDHGRSPSERDEAGETLPSPPGSASLGKQLLGTAAGFSCVSCHAVGLDPALMQLHFGTINLTHSRERLRHEYYARWMSNPQRIQPQSLMPAYTEENGKSALADVLGGDGSRQFEAIWRYLSTIEQRE